MKLAYYRTGGRGVPPDGESVTLADDGAVRGWRGVAAIVGQFEGVLAGDELHAIASTVAQAAEATPPEGATPPGAPLEVITIDDGDPVDVAQLRDAEAGPWDALAVAARELLERMTAFPKAALALSVADGSVRLVHHGTEPLVVDLGTAELRVVRWRGWFEPDGTAEHAVSGPSRESAGPGWSYDLGTDDALDTVDADPDITVHVTLAFAVIAGESVVPVQVSHAPLPDDRLRP
jgi:hypothetical protein